MDTRKDPETLAGTGTRAEPGPTERRRGRPLLPLGLGLIAVGLILVAALGLRQIYRNHETATGEQLATIARLKADGIERWLAERRQDAEVLRTSAAMTRDLPRWRQDQDPQRREDILQRLESVRALKGFMSILVVDGAGTTLLDVGGHPKTASALRQTAARALAEGRIELTDFYRDQVDGQEHLHLDLVAPLPAGAGPDLVLVLRLDPATYLYPFLRDWPLPSETAETLLVRREGEKILFLNPLRHADGDAVQRRVPGGQSRLLADLVAAGEARPREAIRALDYRGSEVLGVGQPIAGTPWHLIAKVDWAEIAADELKIMVLVASVLGLSLGLLLLSGLLLHHRESLRLASLRERDQAERLRGLELLDALTKASSDAIYAKDLEGRYLLFNPAAARICGTARTSVLGRDDRTLFPADQAAAIVATDRRVMAEGRELSSEERLQTADGPLILLTTKWPLRDADGQIKGVFGISRNVTDRARAEDEAKRQLDELRRWREATLGRESRILELKAEVNALLAQAGQAARYPSAVSPAPRGTAVGASASD